MDKHWSWQRRRRGADTWQKMLAWWNKWFPRCCESARPSALTRRGLLSIWRLIVTSRRLRLPSCKRTGRKPARKSTCCPGRWGLVLCRLGREYRSERVYLKEEMRLSKSTQHVFLAATQRAYFHLINHCHHFGISCSPFQSLGPSCLWSLLREFFRL